jgi:FecR protein/Tetratricopeptide repeat
MRRLLILACVWLPLTPILFAQTDAEVVEAENKVEAQSPPAPWKPAPKGTMLRVKDKVRTGEESRAAVRLGDLSVTRLDEFTTFEVGSPGAAGKKAGFDLKQGGAYFFSREKSQEVEIRTPAVNGSLKGTALMVRVDGARTRITVIEGEVVLSNRDGELALASGESGEAWIGMKPRRTAVVEARNIIQWALYYPGILTDEDLPLAGADADAMATSIAAYRRGNLPKAVELFPRGYAPQSAKGRVFRAGLLLAVGQVEDARKTLGTTLASHSGRNALEQVIAAVNLAERPASQPATASGWLAQSYYEQSRGRLESARTAAREATRLARGSGFAWVRLAELEFSFGRTSAALDALARGRALSPENAQAAALQGWLHAAQNRIGPARAAFDDAIRLDGALGAGWLGRGLTSIRSGDMESGLRDIQVATVMEPNRAIYHSYLAKAFSDSGDPEKAARDLDFARQLDAGDPTPWIYSALENKAASRPNTAIRDLERALELTDNRRIYRSTFLLDQDRAVSNANLASIYQGNGMTDVSVREAARAITSDYASAPAHLFLANSYDALRDPRRIQLRYETAWFNELLLANLLAPVGGGSLSQYVSQQEYSKLFEQDGFGLSMTSEALTDGSLRATASQFGTFGNLSYALDTQYYYDNGHRPNNRLSRIESYAKVKLQLTPMDSVFLMAKYQDFESGDLLQRYDNGEAGREIRRAGMAPLKNTRVLTTDFRERQEPGLLLAGWHHEWSPGHHTLLLLGRLANEQAVTARETSQLVLSRDIATLFPPNFPLAGRGLADDPALRAELSRLRGRGEITAAQSLALDSDYLASFEIFSGELNHIATFGPQTFVVGGRWQSGEFDTRHRFDGLSPGLAQTGLFLDPPAGSRVVSDFDRVSIYAYRAGSRSWAA